MGLRIKKRKIIIPLHFFEKLEVLTPSQVKYLKNYQARVRLGKGNPAILERIGIILRKPNVPDPIHSKDMTPHYNLYSKKQNIIKETKIQPNSPKKENWLKKLFNTFDKKNRGNNKIYKGRHSGRE